MGSDAGEAEEKLPDKLDLDMYLEHPPKEVDAHHCTLFFDETAKCV